MFMSFVLGIREILWDLENGDPPDGPPLSRLGVLQIAGRQWEPFKASGNLTMAYYSIGANM